MPDGQKVRFPDDMPREQINQMILTKYPELETGKNYTPVKITKEEDRPWYDSGWVRKPLAVAQGTLNSNLNPVGFIAKGSNYVFGNGKWELPEALRPIEPEDKAEKVLMNAAKKANDVYGTLAIGTGLGNAGFLGEGIKTGSKIANAVLNPKNAAQIAGMAAQGDALATYVDPESDLARFGLEVFGAAPVSTTKGVLKLGSKAIGGAGALARKGMALASGVSDDALKQAYNIGKSGNKAAQQAFKASLKGETTINQVLDDAEDALRKIQSDASSKYAPLKKHLFKQKTKLDLTEINKQAKSLDGSLYDRGALVGDKKNAGYVEEMVDAVKRHSKHPDIRGLDSMRRSVEAIEIPLENKVARRAQTKLVNTIKDTITKQVPQYKKLVDDYSDSMNTIKSIRDALHVGGQNRSTTARSIMQAMRDNVNANFGIKANALKVLEEKGGKELVASLTGQELSSWLPKGLQRGFTGYGLFRALTSGFTPQTAAILASTSPRINANVVNTVGRAVGKLPTINVNGEALTNAIKAIGLSELIDKATRKEKK